MFRLPAIRPRVRAPVPALVAALAVPVAGVGQEPAGLEPVPPATARAAWSADLSAGLGVGPVRPDPLLPRRARFELGAALLTGAVHAALGDSDATAVFIPVAVMGWGGYVYHRASRAPDYLARLGIRSEGLAPSFRDASWVAAAAVAVMAGVASTQGTLDVGADILPLLALYPVWGVAQQTLVQGMVTRNLEQADGWLGSPYAVVPIAAALFGAFHIPDWRLTAATTALGAAFTPIYLRHHNVWPLGLYHGVLGALFYTWVLDENPLRELTG